jgi:hypothetical protein
MVFECFTTTTTTTTTTIIISATNSHIGLCTHAAESANVEVKNVLQGRNNITCSTDCKYRTAATLYTI